MDLPKNKVHTSQSGGSSFPIPKFTCCIFSTVCPYSTHGRKGRFAKGPSHECPFWCVANLSISWAVTLDAVQVEISIIIFDSGSKARKTKQNDSWSDQYVVLISNTGCDQTETFSVDWLQRNVARHIYLDFPFNHLWENRIWRSSKLQNSWLVKAAQHHGSHLLW